LPNRIKDLPLRNFSVFLDNHISDATMEVLRRGYTDQSYLNEILFSDKFTDFDVPALIVTGWYDVFSQGQINNFIGMRERSRGTEAKHSRLIIGPWTHYNFTQIVGDLDFGIQGSRDAIDLDGMNLQWYDHFIKGQENSVDQEAPVKLFIMGENIWRDEQEWPLARTIYTNFYLHGNGRLGEDIPAAEKPDVYVYDPDNPVPTKGGCIMIAACQDGPRNHCEIEERDDVLSFTSPVLEKDVEVTGQIIMNLWASSSAVDTDFVARLVDVYPDGYACLIADGIIRARYREFSITHRETLLEPMKPYLFEIDLWATSNLFKGGHRIRIDLTSSCFPRWDRNPNTGNVFGVDTADNFIKAKQIIFHDNEHPSHLILPIIPRN